MDNPCFFNLWTTIQLRYLLFASVVHVTGEVRRWIKQLLLERLKSSGIQTCTYMRDYFINFDHFTHILFVLIHLHLKSSFLNDLLYAIHKVSPSFVLCLSFFLTSLQLPLSDTAKTHTGKSRKIMFSLCYQYPSWEFAPRIESMSTVGHMLGKHAQGLSELFVHLKKLFSCTKSNICS